MRFLLQQIVTDSKHWLDFRYTELDAVLALHNLNPSTCYTTTSDDFIPLSPYVFIDLPSVDVAHSIANRCVLARTAYECYAHAPTVQDCIDSIPQSCSHIMHSTQPWSIDVYAYGYKISQTEQDVIRRKFSGKLRIKGKVNRLYPELQLSVHIVCDINARTPLPERTIHVYLCRYTPPSPMLTASQPNIDKLILEMKLSTRPYIGPTSTSEDLAMMMCNYACIQRGDYVFDPFVGTGSLLLSAAALGAHVIGTDIDWKSLHGQLRNNDHVNKNIYKNFEYYKLNRPELVCSDCSNTNLCAPSTDELYNAIITDPPYGIRAGAKRAGRDAVKNGVKPVKAVSSDMVSIHIPSLQNYDIEDVMCDLLDTAARTLKLNGRLVYLLPATDRFTADDIPLHPCLSLVHLAEQKLRVNFSRYCVTLQKHSKWTGEQTRRRDRETEPVPAYAAVKDELAEHSTRWRAERHTNMRLPDGLDQPLSRRDYAEWKVKMREEVRNQLDVEQLKRDWSNKTQYNRSEAKRQPAEPLPRQHNIDNPTNELHSKPDKPSIIRQVYNYIIDNSIELITISAVMAAAYMLAKRKPVV